MGIVDGVWKSIGWGAMKKRLGYSDGEMSTLRANPRNVDVLSKVAQRSRKTTIAEVGELHGSNSQRNMVDRLYFDGAGNLLTRWCPRKACIYVLDAVNRLIFAANEIHLAGIDTNEMRFKRAACFDVGPKCGGWGRVVLGVRVDERHRALPLPTLVG